MITVQSIVRKKHFNRPHLRITSIWSNRKTTTTTENILFNAVVNPDSDMWRDRGIMGFGFIVIYFIIIQCTR